MKLLIRVVHVGILFLGVSGVLFFSGAPVLAAGAAQAITPTPAAPQGSGARSAIVREITNQVVSRVTEAQTETTAQVGQVILVGGSVRTLTEGKARVDLSEGTIVRLAPQTFFTVTQLNQNATDPFTRLRLFTGKVWVILNGGSLDVETPVGVASVRGSFMSVNFDPTTGVATFTCLEGLCGVNVNGVFVSMTDNQQTFSNALTIIKIQDKELLEWSANNPEANTFMPPQSGLNDLQFDNGAPLVPCPNGVRGGGRMFSARPILSCAKAE